jgi:hypothetical protein
VNAVARLRLDRASFFFTDHADAFGSYAERLGMNGSYETGIR